MHTNSIQKLLMLSSAVLLFGGSTTVSAHQHHHKNVHTEKIKHAKKDHQSKKADQKHNQANNQTNSNQAQSNQPIVGQWNQGVPTAMQGSWYHNDNNDELKAYIDYSTNQSGGNFFNFESTDQKYVKQDPSGLKQIYNKYLGNNEYEIRGYRYDNDLNNGQEDQTNQYAYKVNVDGNNLHFELGHGVKDYTRNADFTIDNSHMASNNDNQVY